MNKKEWGGNSKTYSTIILVFVVCCFMATSSWAARKVDFYSANAGSFIERLNQNESTESEMIGPLLGLSQDEAFKLLRKKTDFNGVTHYRYQQEYKGIPVWGVQTIISRGPSNQVVRLHGAMVLDIPGNIQDIPSSLDPQGALKKMEDKYKKIDKKAQWTFRNEEYGTYIYLHNLHKKDKAHLCYVVSFFADTEKGNPSQPIFFIEAKNGKVLDSYDMLRYADGIGPGGNEKAGYYYYGRDYPPFGVAASGPTCTMDFGDVKTVDLNHGTSGSTPFSYTCYENLHKEINGAYCPLNDAQFFGQVVWDMYWDWYEVTVLPFQLTMRCHYSTNYENAFWNGSSVNFGDGDTTFYPLVALDRSAHEVSHGFTEYNSDLTYSGQSGGINEAFSDMAGEACEYYFRGSTDYRCGYDIYKAAGQALRYLYDPPLDGISIDHVNDYYEGMDVHYSSGIFNKAFYLIATSPGWNPRMAFDIFVKANQDYWMPCNNFQQGAEGALDAAEDYGYSCQDVVNAFAQVGITLTYPGSPDYCPSSGVSQYYEYIAGVEVGNLNNPSGASPYSDFTHLVANLTQGETVNFELTPGFTGSSYYECWGIWIDYNGDQDFGDAGEQVFSGSGNDVVTGSFVVPDCTVCCPRMRVSMSYYGSGCPTSCGTFPYGEVEDYAVEISGNYKPWAKFTADNTIISQGQSVQFSDKSYNNPTGWSWTFEGGTPSGSDLENPYVTYYTAGTYDVTLTSTNGCGSDTETKVDYITVTQCQPPVPIADFETCVTDIKVGDSIDFTDQSTGYSTSWVWTFEGGTPATSTDRNPTGITYNTEGTYTVSLTATNACGSDTETKTGYINVSDSAYCASWGSPYPLYTTRVMVAALDKSSEDTCYSDFTHLIAHLTQGKTYPVTLQNSGAWPWIFTKIWIDYNRDFDFDDAGEEVFSSYGGSYIIGSISIPCNTILGETRMRVSMMADYIPPFCGYIGLGEVEDYTVNIAGNPGLEYTVGNTTVFGSTSVSDFRRAMPFTMPEDGGTIKSVTMYHEAYPEPYNDDYKMILGVYADNNGSPGAMLGETDETLVDNIADWQTIDLESPTDFIPGGTKIWLAWVYEYNPGIRYQTGSPGRYQSIKTWIDGMPDPFGPGTQANYIYSIYATYTKPECTVGYCDVFPDEFDRDTRRAQPFTMPEDGTINSISMYHEGGTGSDHMILAVYEGEGFPQYRIAKTPATALSTEDDWQDIALESPVFVKGGTNIWLAWVYESIAETTTKIRRQIGFPWAFVGDSGWPLETTELMPELFGCSEPEGYIYSICAKYTPGGGGEPPYERVGNPLVYPFNDNVPNLQAQRFIMPETGCIISVSMYHGSGSGNMYLGVYSDVEGKPGTLKGKTASTDVCGTDGWQTIPLESPTVEITGGTTIWLAWYYDTTPTLKRMGNGAGFQSTDPWTGDMPDPFGSGTQTSKKYSIYANYTD